MRASASPLLVIAAFSIILIAPALFDFLMLIPFVGRHLCTWYTYGFSSELAEHFLVRVRCSSTGEFIMQSDVFSRDFIMELASFALNVALLGYASTAVQQLKLAKHEAGAQVYRKFIEPPVRNARRFVRTEAARIIFENCRKLVEDCVGEWTASPESLSCDEWRSRIQGMVQTIEAKIELQRLQFNKNSSILLHQADLSVPELLNEYNYMANLVMGGVLDKDFGDESTIIIIFTFSSSFGRTSC